MGHFTNSYLETLRYIYHYQQSHDGLSPTTTDMARMMGVVPSSIAWHLKRLVIHGYILHNVGKREPGRFAAGAPAKPITITDKGLELIQQTSERLAKYRERKA